MIYQPRNVQPSASSIDALMDNTFSMEVQTNSYISGYKLYITDFNNNDVYTGSKVELQTYLYNGDTLFIPVESATAGLTNGSNYKWHVRLYQPSYDMLITYSNVLPQSTSTNIYIQPNINIRIGMFLNIGNETSYITYYDNDTGLVAVDTPFTFTPTEGTPYYIYSDFIDTVPDYIVYARQTPVVSISNVPETLTLKYHTFEGLYVQSNKVPITYHVFNLYIENSDGSRSLVDTSGKVYSANLTYTYDSFRTGNTYYIEMIVENEMGIKSDTILYSFDVSYSIIQYLQQPNATFDENNNAVNISWTAPIEHEGFSTAIAPSEVSGEYIYIKDASDSAIENLNINGIAKQESTTGKNLYDISNLNTETKYGITLTKNNDGTLTLNGTATARAMFDFPIKEINATESYKIQMYYFSGNFTNNYVTMYVGTDSQFNSFKSVTVHSDTEKVEKALEQKTYTYARISVDSGVVCNNLVIGCQAVSSDTNVFEKYTGGQASPSPDYPQEIETITGEVSLKKTGKNLFDGELELGGISASTGENNTNSTTIRSKNYIEVKENTTYTINSDKEQSSTIALRYYDKNKNFISSGTTSAKPVTYTTPNNCKYFRFVITLNSNIDTKVQIEEGTQATPYEPYKSETHTVNLQGNELCKGDTLNIDKYGNVKLIKNWGKIVLDGSESSWYFDSGKPGFTVWAQIGNPISPIMLSNNFICENTYTTWTGENKFGTNTSGTLWFQTTVASSVDDFKAWLSTHNTTVYYQLATPEIIDLGKINNISTYEGINNLSITPSTNFELQYNIDVGSSSNLYLYNTPYNDTNSLYTRNCITNWHSETGLCEIPSLKNITLQFSVDESFFYSLEGRYIESAPLIVGTSDGEGGNGNFQILIDKNKLIYSENPNINIESYFYTNTNEVFVLSSSGVKQMKDDYIWLDSAIWEDSYYWTEGGTSLERIVNHWWKVEITGDTMRIEEIFLG